MSTVTLPPPSEISSLSLSHEPLRPPKVKNQNGEGKYDKHMWTWDWEESPQEAPCSGNALLSVILQPHPRHTVFSRPSPGRSLRADLPQLCGSLDFKGHATTTVGSLFQPITQPWSLL